MPLVSLKTLSRALKGVRRQRGLTVQQVATRMGIAKRTYEYFEGGKGGLTLDKVYRFAEATDSDPYAILVATLIGAPELAAACVETKAITILLSALGRAEADLSCALADLTARDVSGAFSATFADLIAAGLQRRGQTPSPADATQAPDLEDPPPD